jgi:hypothetical protein
MDYSQLPHDDGFENAFADEPRRTGGILSPGLASPRPLFDDDPAIGGFGSPRTDTFGGGIGSDGGFEGLGGGHTEEDRLPTSPQQRQEDPMSPGPMSPTFQQEQHQYQQPAPQSPPQQRTQRPQAHQQQSRQSIPQQQRPQHYLHAKITALERTGRKDPILRFDVHVS